MREALIERLKIIEGLLVTRHMLIQNIEIGKDSSKPTKVLEAAELFKVALQGIATSLADDEPMPVTITDQQKTLFLAKSVELVTRAQKLQQNLNRSNEALMTDHVGRPIVDWTSKLLDDIEAHVVIELPAIKDAIDAL